MIKFKSSKKISLRSLFMGTLIFHCFFLGAQTLGPDGSGRISSNPLSSVSAYHRSFSVLKTLTLKTVDINAETWHAASGCTGGTNSYTIDLYQNQLLLASKNVTINCGTLTTATLNFEDLTPGNYELRVRDAETGQLNVTEDYSEKSITDVIVLHDNTLNGLTNTYSGAFFNWTIATETGMPISLSDTIRLCRGHTTDLNYREAYSGKWSSSEAYSSLNDSTIRLSPSKTVTYYLDKPTLIPAGINIVQNGDFEQGNTGFSSEYLYNPAVDNASEYTVGSNGANALSGINDYSPGTSDGKMLIANGADVVKNLGQTNQRGLHVWCQTMDVYPNTDYQIDFWYLNATNTTENFSFLSIELNNVHNSSWAYVSSVWSNNLSTVWKSGSNTRLKMCIRNSAANASGNNFIIDDITVSNTKPIVSYRRSDSVLVIVEDAPLLELGNDTTICNLNTNPLVLNAGSEWDNYNWSNSKTTQNISITTPGTYTITSYRENGCTATDNIVIKDITCTSQPEETNPEPTEEPQPDESDPSLGPEVSTEDYFSPNGDKENDFIRITVKGESQIINFEGKILRTVNYGDLWDGTSYKGTLLGSGVYLVVGHNDKQVITLLR